VLLLSMKICRNNDSFILSSKKSRQCQA
jgi:hypothetical protein